jgi:hypothetical protein
MRKFQAGGRCGGDSGCHPRETNPEFAGAYSALLAARSQQDSLWTQTPVSCQPQAEKPQSKPQLQSPPFTQSQQQLVVLPSQKPKENKKADIDFILDEF